MVVFAQLVTLAASALALAPILVFAGPNGPSSFNFINPYTAGKVGYANKGYAAKLQETVSYFTSRGDSLNAAKTRTVQNTPTFRWLASISNVSSVFCIACCLG